MSDYPVNLELDPQASCPQTITKVDMINWEKGLKTLLLSWILDPDSPFNKVYEELSAPLMTAPAQQAQRIVEVVGLPKTMLPLVTNHYKQNALHAILFNLNRSACEKIALAVVHDLEQAEKS